jgi:hypothetical protein
MFIFPDCTYPNPGGAENLIYQVIKEMQKKYNQASMIIGSQDTYLTKRLSAENISFKFVDQKKMDKNIINAATDDNDVIILFHNYDGLEKLINLKCSVLIWGILAQQITGWNRFGFEKKITGKKILGDYFTKRLLVKMNMLNGLLSMDGATSDVIESFVGDSLNLPIIPVPIEATNTTRQKKSFNANHNLFCVSYIGRSDDIWKIKPLKKIISDLGRVKDHEFTILIYTHESEPFERELSSVLTPSISLKYYLGIYGEELRNHLNKHSDLHFSMGTAALEGALSGVPTILIDPSSYDFPDDYKYKWLYETERCSLGRFIERGESGFNGITINEVVDACISEHTRNMIADLCFSYVIKNHSVSQVVDKLVNLKIQARMKDVMRNTPAMWRVVSFLKGLL